MWVTTSVWVNGMNHNQITHQSNIARVLFTWFMTVLLIPSNAVIATFSCLPMLLIVSVTNCPFFPVVDWTDLVIAFAITDGTTLHYQAKE